MPLYITMGGLIEALSGFTGQIELLQANMRNLVSITPGVIDSAKELSTKLSQLSPNALKNLHEPPIITELGREKKSDTQASSLELDETRLNLMRETSYHARSNITCPIAPPEIGEGYQFNHGIFKDNLDSYKHFISNIGKEFTVEDESIQKHVAEIKTAFSSWLNEFNSIHDSINGAIPIENIREEYNIPLRLMSREEIDKIKNNESLAAQSSLRWLNLASHSLKLLDKINTGDLSPRATYKSGELKKFLLKEMEEKFTNENIQKLCNLCKKNRKALDLVDTQLTNLNYLKENIRDKFEPSLDKYKLSNLDAEEGLSLNIRNINYIEGFFEEETKKQQVNIEHLCATLNRVHEAYTKNYPLEGDIGNPDRYKIASQILNIVQLIKKQSRSETQEVLSESGKTFVSSLEGFYTIEKEKTASL
jgi:hypothetical protein